MTPPERIANVRRVLAMHAASIGDEADVLPSAPMPRGGKREGAGRRSAFGEGAVLVRRSVRMPAAVWAELDALAKEWGTTDDGAIARLLRERQKQDA